MHNYNSWSYQIVCKYYINIIIDHTDVPCTYIQISTDILMFIYTSYANIYIIFGQNITTYLSIIIRIILFVLLYTNFNMRNKFGRSHNFIRKKFIISFNVYIPTT